MRLPISVFEYETGINYKADIPMAILGEVPKPVYSDADRQRELKLLKKAIGTFGLDGNPEVQDYKDYGHIQSLLSVCWKTILNRMQVCPFFVLYLLSSDITASKDS